MENFCEKGKLEKKEGYDVCRGVDAKNGLRYDLTLLHPSSQTAGHYHMPKLPELFGVLSGDASFLTQNPDAKQTYLISAKENDKVVILPDFSIRTINSSGEKELLIFNWISDKAKNDYNAFTNLQEPIKLKPKKLPAELENLDFLTNPEKYAKLLTIENLYEQI
ncbi:MAG: glucose-6-phosphate isomerase family protein [Candidatus Paceibacterota bacterium]